MNSGFLLHSLLLGPASLNVQEAAARIGAERDVFEIRTALELISASAEDDVTGSFRAQFADRLTALQAAPTNSGAIRIVEEDVVPLLKTITDASWERIARRFGTAAEASRILKSPGVNSWMPEIQAEGEEPAQVRLFEYLTSSMIRNLLGVSVVENDKNSDWRRGLFESGLLEARTVRVLVSPLPQGSEFGLQAKWGLSDGSPFVTIAHQKGLRCTVPMLAYAILRSCRTSGHPKVSLNASEMTYRKRPSPAVKNALANIGRLMWLNESIAYVEKLIDLQEEIFSGEGFGRIRKALEGLPLPKKMRNHLNGKLNGLWIRLGVEPLSQDRASYAAFSWRPEEKFAALGNWKQTGTLFITLGLAQRYLTLASQEELWTTVARAYAAWAAEGEPSKETRVLFPVEDLNRENAGRSVVFQPDMIPLSPLPEISNELVEEYHGLFHWLPGASQRRDFFSGTPALEEIGGLLADTDLVGLRHFKFPIAKLRWIDQPVQGEPTLSLDRESEIHTTWEATIRGDLKRLLSQDPLDLLEMVTWWAQRMESTLKVRRRYKPVSLFMPLTGVTEAGDAWAWLRLFRRYEKLALAAAPAGFQILGSSAKALAPEIAPALQKYHLTDPLKVQTSLSRHTVWITDGSHVDVPSVVGNKQTTAQKAATRVSILAASRAKILHFNGRPQFDRETWELLVRVALEAPAGLTWLDPDMPWSTNRPSLTVEAGDEGWYALNAHYAAATAQNRAAYRWALSYVRSRSKEASLPSLEPRSAWREYRGCYNAMMLAYHPDRRGTAHDAGGAFRNLKKAFNILADFYRQ